MKGSCSKTFLCRGHGGKTPGMMGVNLGRHTHSLFSRSPEGCPECSFPESILVRKGCANLGNLQVSVHWFNSSPDEALEWGTLTTRTMLQSQFVSLFDVCVLGTNVDLGLCKDSLHLMSNWSLTDFTWVQVVSTPARPCSLISCLRVSFSAVAYVIQHRYLCVNVI